jgi:hypothetical protein
MLNLNYLYFTVSGNYVLSNQKFTWHGAKSRGNFATPNINITNSLVTVDILNNLKNEEAWVGYYSKETAFAYIGKKLYEVEINYNSKGFIAKCKLILGHKSTGLGRPYVSIRGKNRHQSRTPQVRPLTS